MSIWGEKPKRLKTNIETIMEQGLHRRLVVDVTGSFRHKMLVEKNDNGLYTVSLFEPNGFEMRSIAVDIVERHMCMLVNHALSSDKSLTRIKE